MPQAILVNKEVAYRLFDTLLLAQERKLPPYDQVESVQGPRVLPPNLVWGSSDHARFLFLTCFYMKGKINSATAIIALSQIFGTERWVFEPDTFRNLNGERESLQKEIKRVLETGGLGFNSKETSEYWVYNFRKLVLHWEGNPASLFAKAETYDELCDLFFRNKKTTQETPSGFYGFRHKMVSMLTYFYEDANIIKPFPYPVPVDFHILRVLVAHGVLYTEDLAPGARLSVDYLSQAARKLTVEYCAETGTKAILLSEALWHLSREFCVESPSNSSSISREYAGRRTGIKVREVTWTKTQSRKSLTACGLCSVAETCTLAIPSANYYVQGVVLVRGPREKPLDLFAR